MPNLTDDVEAAFVAVAARVIEDAERIDCTLREFYAGLRCIRAAVDARLEAEASEVDDRWEHTEPAS